jgi:hypothetical protein
MRIIGALARLRGLGDANSAAAFGIALMLAGCGPRLVHLGRGAQPRRLGWRRADCAQRRGDHAALKENGAVTLLQA